ncbi:centrin-2-like [Ornithodoros turicata]|uniref:centrin-2-like n=1 Tax=Ornithodoros turicata TaxID=34597 RepID=UPI0031395057
MDDCDVDYSAQRTAFALFDQEGLLELDVHQLKLAVRSLGMYVTEGDFESVLRSLRRDSTAQDERYNYADFVTVVSRLHSRNRRNMSDDEQSAVKDSVSEVFKYLDGQDTGGAACKDLSWLLRTVGEPLTQEETESFFRDTGIMASGSVTRDKLLEVLLSDPFKDFERK